MMKFILPLILVQTCFSQMYIPRLSRDPNSRPSIIRFRRPPLRNLHSMEASPSDTNSKLSLPTPEPFIPGAIAYSNHPSESVGVLPQRSQSNYNNFAFSPSEEVEVETPVQNDASEGEASNSFPEEVPLQSNEPVNPEEQGYSPQTAFDETPFMPEDSIALDYSEEGNEFLLSDENKEMINNEGNFPGETVNDYEYVNNEQHNENSEQVRKDQAPSAEFNENINVEKSDETITNKHEEVTESSISKPDYIYEENIVESPEEYFEESANKDESTSPEPQIQPRTEADVFEPSDNSQTEHAQYFNSKEAVNMASEEKDSNTPIYTSSFEHPSFNSQESVNRASEDKDSNPPIYTSNEHSSFNSQESVNKAAEEKDSNPPFYTSFENPSFNSQESVNRASEEKDFNPPFYTSSFENPSFNSQESVNRASEEKNSNPPFYVPSSENLSETSKETSKLAKSAESFFAQNQSPIYKPKQDIYTPKQDIYTPERDNYTPKTRRRPTFNLRSNVPEEKAQEQRAPERYPTTESETNEYSTQERHEPKKEESLSSRSKYSSFNENSIHKLSSFSNSPRIISQPKYQAEESRKRRRPYKPFYEPTPAPYEEENHLGDYQDYTDDNEKKEPDRLSVLLQQTKFNCLKKNDGYYADEQLECEVFHFCQDKVRHSWLCPSGSSFHQVHLICMPQSDDNICEKSSNFHFVNDYLYKEAPESTGRNRTYVQRYYPKGYEGGIAFLEEQQSISKNPTLHKALSPYEKQQFRQANNRRNPPRDYHPQHSVQAHERTLVREQQQNDVPTFDETSLERISQGDYQQNDVNTYEEEPNHFDNPQTDFEQNPNQEEYVDTHQVEFEENIKQFKEEPVNYQENNPYQLKPLLSTRHENVPFANTPTQGHIRRPQEMFPRPQRPQGPPFLLNDRNPGNIRRVPHPFYRRLGSTFNQ